MLSAYSPRLNACLRFRHAAAWLSEPHEQAGGAPTKSPLCRAFASPWVLSRIRTARTFSWAAAEIPARAGPSLPPAGRNKTSLPAARDGKNISQHFIERLVALLNVLLQGPC